MENRGAIMNKRILLVLALLIAVIPAVMAVPVTVQQVKVDGTTVDAGSTNRLSIDRGQDFEVRVEVLANADVPNAEIEAFIAGYEYNDLESISDTTSTFDMQSGVIYSKKLTLRLPDRVDSDDYRLRIIIADRNGETTVQDYRLTVDRVRNLVVIRDIVLNPADYVTAGRSLLASVRITNFGERDEDNMKVTVSIPELGVSGIDYINNNIEPDESTTSEEIMLRIPSCTKEGTYTVRAVVEYRDQEKATSKDTTIRVIGTDCVDSGGSSGSSGTTTQPATVIGVDSQMQELTRGVGGGIFAVTITNHNSNTQTYTLSLTGYEQIATVRMTPSNVLVIGAGQTQTAYVYVAANENARLGPAAMTLTISANGQPVKQMVLQANIVDSNLGPQVAKPDLVKILETVFIILLIVIIIIGIIIMSQRRTGGEGQKGEEYY